MQRNEPKLRVDGGGVGKPPYSPCDRPRFGCVRICENLGGDRRTRPLHTTR